MSAPAAAVAVAEPIADGLPTPRRYWAIAAILMALVVAVLDSAVANVALPTLSRQLKVSPSESIWIVNAYQLAVAVTLLPVSVLGDRFGYRRLYLAGLALFATGSALAALSHSLAALAAARAVTGVGGACIMAINPALIRYTYPRAQLAHGMARNVMIVGMCSALAPTVAGAILAVAPWQWLFAFNVPVGCLALTVAFIALPRMEGRPRRIDVAAAILSAATFGLVILGADNLVHGAMVLGLSEMAAGAMAGVLLVRRELQQLEPLLPLDLLRAPRYRLGLLTAMCGYGAQMMAIITLPFWMQGELGLSPAMSGLLITPWPAGMALVSPLAPRLAERIPVYMLCAAGLCVLACGAILLALTPHDATAPNIVWRIAVCGIGFGLFMSLNNKALMDSAPIWRSGAAGGMLALGRLIGQAISALVVATLFHLGGRHTAQAAFMTAAGISIAAALASLARSNAPDVEGSATNTTGRTP